MIFIYQIARIITFKVIYNLNLGITGITHSLTAALISGVSIIPLSYKVY